MSVAPVSAMISGSRSAWRADTSVASFVRRFARSSGDTCFQAGSASRAAPAAASASATDDSGASSIVSSVAGLTIP